MLRSNAEIGDGKLPVLGVGDSLLGASLLSPMAVGTGSGGVSPGGGNTPHAGAGERATNTTAAAAAATIAAMNGPPMRYMTVNGVEYPASVAAHIPKYYMPKAHLQKQKYPDSAVLRCYVDPDVVTEARATYARYAERVLEEAARDPYGPTFRSKEDAGSGGGIAPFRFGIGARSSEIPTTQQLVLEWDDDNLPTESVEQPLLDKRGSQSRAEPLLVRVPASATPGQALPIVLKTIMADVKVRLRELHQQANGRGSPPSRTLTPVQESADPPPAFAAWTADGLKKLRALCEEQLEQLEREARAANDALQAASATPEQKRVGRRGTGRRSGKASKAAGAKEPAVSPGEDGMPPLEPPSIGFRPCDLNGSILAPEAPAGSNQAAPQTTKAAQTPSRRNRRGSVNFGNVGGVSPSRPTPPGAFGLGMPALGGAPLTPGGGNSRGAATPSGPQPLSPMAGASASSPAVTKHCVVRRVLDAATPLSQQLTMPFNIAITVDRDRARDFVRHANVAARVVQQREVQARQARRCENITGREARVQQMEEASRNESLVRDEAVRAAIRHQQSTGLKEVGIWQRERAAAERNARLAAEAEAKRRTIEAEEEAIAASLRVIAAAKASCAMDETEARDAVADTERLARTAILSDAASSAGKILKQQRIKQRMRLVPGITERVVLGRNDVAAGSMFA